MKLTKQQRHIAYIIMLIEIEEKFTIGNFRGGLCRLFHNLHDDNEYSIRDSLLELNKKLLLIHEKYDDYFVGTIFPESKQGWKQRIKILKQCIAETY